MIDRAALDAIAEAAERLADACRNAARTSADALAEPRHDEPLSTPMSPPVHRSYLTQKQLATRLGCDVRTLRRWVHEGEVPAPIRIGAALRWDPEVVDAWISQEAAR